VADAAPRGGGTPAAAATGGRTGGPAVGHGAAGAAEEAGRRDAAALLPDAGADGADARSGSALVAALRRADRTGMEGRIS